nr:thiolase family protein [Sphingomonas sp. CDS-1]
MVDVAIVGVGETVPVRADSRPMSVMIADAIHRALADAGIGANQIDGFVTESATMPGVMPAEDVVAALGVPMPRSPFIAYGLHYGAGLVAAAELAGWALASGRATHVLCWYGHQLSRQAQGPRALYADDPLKADLEMPSGWFGQPVYFAGIAQRYAHEFGLPAEALAAVAMEAREHAARTPGAMKTAPLDLAGYLASPSIATPLRGPDCALVNDGAIAFVMTTTERARDCAHPVVRVAGVGVGSTNVPGDTWFTQNSDYLTTPAAISGPAAFAVAGLTPDDVDFVELYDCFSINTILQYEDLGFVKKGEGAAFAMSKGRGLGDRLPTNTHGGLLSHSFLLGGGHVVEAVRQLRHERAAGQVPDARVGLVTALGVPHHSTMILERM